MTGDRIALRGVRATGYHGVFEHEKRDGQEFVVDVVLALDLTRAGQTDELAETVDYGGLASAVVARIEGEPFDLIERLAAVIADDVLDDVRVDEVEVTVHKPQAPVPVPFGDVAVTVTRTRRPAPVVIALGANLPHGDGTPAETVVDALEQLEPLAELDDMVVSSLYETDPVGGPEQPVFVNAVVTATTTLSPATLLEMLHVVEFMFARTREVRWGPRTLDVDLVQYGDPRTGRDVVSDAPALTLPHPRAHERGFVLVPWLDADPDAVLRHDGAPVRVADLVRGLDTSGVRRRGPATAQEGQQ
ncbi:dihydroneopterin aldolase [uncultured Phycicoccus sp.]|uniref:dihydroneopterin aldolase n=1 Tax=uncultured Phycicoccus sp. TaxID=661422 RepID=UPI002636B217|nr:dihydroneopterin aldolase [uncultured Phycicoccus sp.]